MKRRSSSGRKVGPGLVVCALILLVSGHVPGLQDVEKVPLGGSRLTASSGLKAQPVIMGPQEAPSTQATPRLPLFFTNNQGALPPEVKFVARHQGMIVMCTAKGISLALPIAAAQQQGNLPPSRYPPSPGADLVGPGPRIFPPTHRLVHLTLVGMASDPAIEPWEPLEGKVHALVGNRKEQWQTGLIPYRGVIYREVYPGIDLKIYGNGSELEYDVIVRPGGNPDRVKFRYAGIKRLRREATGGLLVELPGGESIRQRKPFIYQEISGRRVPVRGSFRVYSHSRQPTYGFALASYDRGHPLIIDPVLEYATYLGGANAEIVLGQSLAVDAQGNAYIIGSTGSSDLTCPPSAYQTEQAGGFDVFVAKFSSQGALVYITYLGGLGVEFGHGIAVDAEGSVYLTGYTNSDNFPVVNPIPGGESLKNGLGNYDAFVAQLSADGSSLLFSTFLGGAGRDYAFGLALDRNRHLYVVGATNSLDFPTTVGAFQEVKPGPENDLDVFVTKINPANSSLVYSTYLGGSLWDLGYGITVDDQGRAHFIGTTCSEDLAASPLRPFGGGADAFVAMLEADGGALGYFTFLGGSDQDEGSAIAVDMQGNAYVTGATRSDDFFTLNPFQQVKGGPQDAFAARISPPISSPVPAPARITWATYLGGSQDDYGYGIALDAAGYIYVAGSTNSPDFPTKQSLRPYAGGLDGFLTKLTPTGDTLVYSTFLGGSDDDLAFALGLDAAGSVFLLGTTTSCNFPVFRPYQQCLNGSLEDVFLVKIDQRTPKVTPILQLLLLDQ